LLDGEDTAAVPASPGSPGSFAELLDARRVAPQFQPVLDLSSGQVTGLEALARGPQDSPFASPAALFAAAARAGRVAELDWVCRVAAFRAVLDAGLPSSLSLFVNVDADSLSAPCPPDLLGALARAESQLRVFVEVNDRALAAEPASLLTAVDRAREHGWGVAVDDVGASRGCLALLDVIQPDVVKLDLRILAGSAPEHAALVVGHVQRHVERTGACLLAEGLETEDDVRFARALGARFGQGHHVGRPAPLAGRYPHPAAVLPVLGRRSVDVPSATLSEQLDPAVVPVRMTRTQLSRLLQLAVHRAGAASGRPLVLAGLGRADEVAASDLQLLAGLDGEALLLVMFGAGVTERPARGVRGVRLRSIDPLARERFVVTLTEDSCAALVARPVEDSRGEFDVVSTQDEVTVQRLARWLVRRMPATGQRNTALLPPEPAAAAGEPSDTAQPGWLRTLRRRGR